MKRIVTLFLAALFLLGALALASCGGGKKPEETASGSGATTTAAPETTGTTADPDSGNEPEGDPETIVVADAKAAGMTGDAKAVFTAETNGETVVTGAEQSGVCYSVVASLSHPTVLTQVAITAPTADQDSLASATIDASVNGTEWVTLKTLGNLITAGKTYTLNINDSTAYLFVRIRQSDGMRTKAFTVRTLVFQGIEKTGEAGNLAAVAEETEQGSLIAMTAYVASSNESGEPANVFLDNNQSWTAGAGAAGAPNWLITTMSKKTEIRKIVVKLWASNRRPRGTVVQASLTGAEWVDLYTIPDLRDAEGNTAETGEWTWYVNDTEQYSFIRLVQREDLAAYAWTLDSVLVYGVESEEAANALPRKYVDSKTVNVTLHEDHTEAHTNPEEATAADLWDTTDKTSEYTHKEHPDLTSRVLYWVSGKFDDPTVITKIVYYSPAHFASRVRTSYFEASVDGETWVKIATLPGSSDLYANSGVITLSVDDDTAYNYIRLVQGEGFYKYYWTIGTAEIIGLAETAG